MNKILSTKYSQGSFNFTMLLFRVTVGVLMLSHGYTKLIHFNVMRYDFLNFLGLGSTLSLSLDIFAELFCSIFVILGLFTRLAVLPIMIAMAVALFKVHHFHLFAEGERATFYLAGCLLIAFCGPGRISVDGLIGK